MESDKNRTSCDKSSLIPIVTYNQVSSETIENFRNVKSTNWAKSYFIASEKFYKLSSCDKNYKLTFLCALCPSKPGVHISADLSSSCNLRVHIMRKHKDSLSEFDYLRKNRPHKRSKELMRSSESPLSIKKSKVQTTLNFEKQHVNESAKKQNEFEKALIELVVDAMLPLSLVENTKFIDLFAKVCPSLNVPSRRTVGRHLLSAADTVKTQLKQTLHLQKHVCTTADIWSTKHRSYMGVSVHWINTLTLQRESGVLGCYRFIGNHTFDKVGEMLDTIQRDFGISETKIVATVTDNGSNFVKAFREYGIKVIDVSDFHDLLYLTSLPA